MGFRKNYSVTVKTLDDGDNIGLVECHADDVEKWVVVGVEDYNLDQYLSLPLTIDEAKDLIDALNLAIEDAKRNRP